jgi:O-antigen/teichoic acid export membrane protein
VEDTEIIAQPPAGHRLIKHSLLNAVGQGAPIAVALFAVPVLMRQLGIERLGVLMIAWSVVGYFSLFDLGLSRALTQLIAEHRRIGSAELSATVRRALTVMAVVGLVAGLIALLTSRWLTERALTVSPDLRAETLTAFRLLAFGIPLVVLSTGFRGVLEGFERFDLVTAVRIPLGISTFMGPLIMTPFTRSLPAGIAVILLVRLVTLVILAVMANRVLPLTGPRSASQGLALQTVMRSGAWMTVSNILSPIMTVADRFFIGGIVSTSVVAYYTAPYEMTSKLSGLVAVAVATSLFPAFASWRGTAEVRALYSRGLRLTFFAFAPLMLIVIVFAQPILGLWMGADFARESAQVLRILGVGVLMNGMAQVPFALIQALGRADLTAKIHVAEVPAYLLLVVELIRAYGVVGAAIAWTIRVTVDAAVLFFVSRHLLASPPPLRAAAGETV